MKKNKILYLIFTLITIFSFTTSVNAAKELTCIATRYEGEVGTGCAMLKQLSDGTYKLYTASMVNNSCNHDASWNLFDEKTLQIDIKTSLGANRTSNIPDYFDENKELKRCPLGMRYTYPNRAGTTHSYTFFDEEVGSLENIMATTISLYRFDEFVPENNEDVINTNSGIMIYDERFIDKSFDDIINSQDKWLSELETNYNGSCLYGNITNDNADFVIVQLDYSNTGVKTSIYASLLRKEDVDGLNNSGNFPTITASLSAPTIKNEKNGECPDAVFYQHGRYVTYPVSGYETAPFKVALKSSELSEYPKILYLKAARGDNFATGEKLQDIDLDNIGFSDIELGCDNIFGESNELKDKIRVVYKFIKIFVPICLVVLGTLDFAKSVFSGSEDEMKKTTKKFITRVVIAVMIFLVPIVLEVLLKIASNIWGVIDPTFCGILDE